MYQFYLIWSKLVFLTQKIHNISRRVQSAKCDRAIVRSTARSVSHSLLSAARHRFLVKIFRVALYNATPNIVYTSYINIVGCIKVSAQNILFIYQYTCILLLYLLKRDRETERHRYSFTYINPLVCSHVHMFIHGAIYTDAGSRAKLKFRSQFIISFKHRTNTLKHLRRWWFIFVELTL